MGSRAPAPENGEWRRTGPGAGVAGNLWGSWRRPCCSLPAWQLYRCKVKAPIAKASGCPRSNRWWGFGWTEGSSQASRPCGGIAASMAPPRASFREGSVWVWRAEFLAPERIPLWQSLLLRAHPPLTREASTMHLCPSFGVCVKMIPARVSLLFGAISTNHETPCPCVSPTCP